MVREIVAITITGLPSLQGENPERFIAFQLHHLDGVVLLCPVQFLTNGIEPTNIRYGVFVYDVPVEGLARRIVEQFRKKLPDANQGCFRVTASTTIRNDTCLGIPDFDVYDESEDGYLS